MLTKNLIRYSIRKNQIFPKFINVNDRQLINISSQFLDLFRDSHGKTREELLSESKIIIDNNECNPIITRGFEKLLLDRTKFNTDIQEELIEFRKNLFTFTSQLHNQKEIQDIESYYKAIFDQFNNEISDIQNQLYIDHPLNQPVTQFKSLSPERLLHRYNCAQIQGLLIHCDHIILKIVKPESASLRQLFKYLRFYQLLAEITRLKDNSGFQIKIDGPLSLFYQTKKYGFNLAFFFPAILHQKQWSIEANIQLRNRKALQLELNHECNIKSHYNHFMAYIPDEVSYFQNSFKKKFTSWDIMPSENLIKLQGESYCFPDYSLKNEMEQTIDLELFHTWHSRPLIYRLKQLEKVQKPILILGVNKKLLNDPTIANYIENSEYFKNFGFIFRDMPTVNSIKPVLDIIDGLVKSQKI